MKIEFKRDTSFRKLFFVPDSFAHPAKMDAQLLIWIVEKYTNPGDTILDPMAGSGTAMLACTLGRNVVLVELEEKFCKMMRDNWNEVRMRPQLGSNMGECQIIQGDARWLEGSLVDKCIFSPPYAEAQEGAGIAKRGYQGSKHSPTDLIGKRSYMPDIHGNSEGQIGNLPYGSIDAVVSSPPYGDEPTVHKKYLQIRSEMGRDITKPSQRYTKYSDVGSIITSPPYGLGEGIGHSEKQESQIRQEKYAGIKYGETQGNIGNLTSQSYLEAMLQVYQQCHKVLKSRGLMILVTKNFIRDKQIVRLDEDTIKLCEQAGFSFLERHSRKLPGQSFWRIIYHQKYPGVEKIRNEDVLVFTK